ncbi:hypothetical protein quinque_007315 [Culex quinquefasciatus]
MREKFEIMTDQEHYSLRWNNHQNHILRAFDTLLQTKTLVDVTLVCAETSIRAHKVVLSACSPFFQRVFSETPCKHPVIVLKDFRGWVVQAIVDFMYRGEISVPQERLSVLIQAGESLQVRGLVDHPVAGNTPTPAQSPEDFSLLDSSLISPTSPALSSPNFSHHQHRNQNSTATGLLSSSTPKLLLPPQVFADPTLNLPNPDICTSPMPRRKQARPRRRSGDCGPQDLSSKPASPVPPMQDKEEEDDNEMDRDEEEEDEDDDIKEILRRSESDEKPEEKTPSKASEHNEKDKNNSTASTATLEGPENLCLKKSSSTSSPGSSSSPGNNSASKDASPASLKEDSPQSQIGRLSLKDIRHLNRPPTSTRSPTCPTTSATRPHTPSDPRASPRTTPVKPTTTASGGDGGHPNNGRGSDSGPLEERNLRKERHQHGGPKDFLHSPTLNFPPFFNQSDGGPHPRPPHSPLSSFPHMSSVSSLTLTPPHMFSLDSPLGLFPPGMDLGKNYSPLMEMSDPRGMHHDGPPFLKHKKMNRPKGQHSAPRGDPPDPGRTPS